MPNEWPTVSLGKHAYIKARIGWRGLSSSEYTSSGAYLIAGQHLRNGRVLWQKCDFISLKRYEESKEIALKPDDVIISKDGTIGRAGYIENIPGLATINGTMMLIRPEKGLYGKFLYHYLNSRKFQDIVQEKVSGSSIPHIFQRDMVWLDLPLPPLPEQRRIAEILDTLDRTIDSTQRIIEKLQATRQGLLHDLLTRGLDEHGQLRDPERNPEQFKETELGLLPREWLVKTVGHLLDRIEAGHSPDCPEIAAQGDQWGVLKVSAVHPNGFKPYENKVVLNSAFHDESTEVKHGDLLITRANTHELVGLSCYVKNPPRRLMLSDKTLRLISNTKLIVPEFLFLLTQTPDFRNSVRNSATGSSAGMKNFSQQSLRSITVAYPESLSEQNKILAVMQAQNLKIDTEQTRLAKLQALKRGLMDDLLTGRVRVPTAPDSA